MVRRFGSLIPATNTTVEYEFNRLPVDDLQLLAARLGKGGDTPFTPSTDADIDYQSQLLGAAKVEVLCLAQTSASLFDDNYDDNVMKRMSDAAGAPALTSAVAVGRAAHALGASRIALVSPYSDAVIARAKQYYQTNFDLDVAAMSGFGATDAYAIGGLDASHAVRAFETIDQPDIEALVVLGGNFPTLRHIEDWEARFGKPVINTNQAALWAMLDIMNYRTPLPGLGRLLTDFPSI